jgi:TATA-box binding protein (TBP) (component of TFIID and TFIIIB)
MSGETKSDKIKKKRSKGQGTSTTKARARARVKPIDPELLKQDMPQITKAYPVTVNNVICKFSMKQRLDLSLITHALKGYRVERSFPSMTVQSDFPRGTVNFFATGNVVISGARSRAEAASIAWKMCSTLTQVLQTPFQVHDFVIVNLVSSFSLGYPIDRDLLYNDYPAVAQFAPEDISLVAMDLATGPPRIKLLVYKTGRGVVTGALHHKQLEWVHARVKWERYNENAPYRKLDDIYRKTWKVDKR